MEAQVFRKDLLAYLQNILQPELFQDYCPNGLQVEGIDVVRKMIVGVTANKNLIQKAIENKADALLVHHGIFWKDTPAPIIGVQYQRIKALIDHNINLIAYHLPLDAHQTLGNHVQLAQKLGIEIEQFLDFENQPGLVLKGNIGQQTPQTFVQAMENVLNRAPLYIPGTDPNIKQLGICTGAAHSLLPKIHANGMQMYLTGEHSLTAVEYALENGIHLIAAGHHATERYGVQALGAAIAKQFNIEVDFIDIPNPV